MRDGLADSQLVVLARSGNRGAFDALIERHFDAVFAVAMARLGDRDGAQDLAQEVFLRAWLNIAALRDGEKFAAWACRMTRHLAINWLRDGTRRSRLARMVPMSDEVHDTVQDEAPGAAERLGQAVDAARLEAALAKLDPAERELVLLHFREEVSQRELAQRLGVHHTTVGRRLESVLGRLRGLLGVEPRAAQLPKAPAQAKAGAMALVAAAAAMPAASQAALAAAAKASLPLKATLSLGAGAELLQATTTVAVEGLKVMTITQKLGAGAVALACLGGGAALYHQHSAGAGGAAGQAGLAAPAAAAVASASGRAPDRVIQFEMSQPERTIEIETGERVRLAVTEAFFEAEWFDFTALPDGTLLLSKDSGEPRDMVIQPNRPGRKPLAGEGEPTMTSVQIWEEENLCLVSSVHIQERPGGLTLNLFVKNNPALLPKLTEASRAWSEGRVSKRQLGAYTLEVLEQDGMLPRHEGNRALVRDFILEGLYR